MATPPDLPTTLADGAECRSTCCYCGVGCGVVIHRDQTGKLALRGDETHPVNRGMLCSKGRTLLHVVRERDSRIQQPALRGDDGRLHDTSWDQALDQAATRLRAIIDEHGPRSVAIYCSGQMLTEEYYLANKLMKGCIGSNNIDTNSRLCMSSAVMGYKLALGSDAPPTCYDDVEQCDTFFVAGANPAWCHPILFRRMEARLNSDPNVRMVVVDPRQTATTDLAHLHLAPRPGTDTTLFHAIAHWLIANDAIDRDFIEHHTSGFAELAELVADVTPAHAAAICDVPEQDICAAAELLSGERRFLSMWTMGLNQSAVGTAKNLSLINLSLLTGKIGSPGNGPFSLTGQPNAMGGREVGGMATLLAGHRDLKNPEHRAEVAQFWGCDDIDPQPGLTAIEMFDALADGSLKAVWVIATNPAASLPASVQAEQALRQAELVIAQDCFPTETTDLADIVFPAATWLEKTGTMTNAERRITLLEPAVVAPGVAKPDTWILQQMGQRLGYGQRMTFADEAAIFDEHVALTRGRDIDIGGVSYAHLREHLSVQWPRINNDAQATGTDRLYTDHQFQTPDRRARLHAVEMTSESEAPDSDYPLVLTTGRLRDQWHTMTKTGTVAKLRSHESTPFVEINPEDAAASQITAGDPVDITSRRGTIRLAARLTDRIRRGCIFVPMHWGKQLGGELGRINNCTNPAFDPISKQPALKHAAVHIARHNPEPRLIRIIGGGAAALALVQQLRRLGRQDPIHIHGDEPEAIYDRVLLPHYIDGSMDWTRLVRADRDQLSSDNVVFHPGTAITAIDRERRHITDAEGRRFDYDHLVLATGSRPAVPFSGTLPKHGVHALRRRHDAERLRRAVGPNSTVAIIGGGLLGLELADALRLRGATVHVCCRSSRLMSKQLDTIASDLLVAELRRRNIHVHLNADLQEVTANNDRPTSITLHTGHSMAIDELVFATGTIPNTELARAAGLTCGRGITSDQHLRTSDPAISAIGECAEIAEVCYGTTATAVEQASALAEILRGNPHAPYHGSVGANILKLHDYQLASAGRHVADPDLDEVVTYHDPYQGRYLRAVIRNDRVHGVIMVGDTARFSEFRDLIASGTELEDQRATLFAPGGSSKPVRGALVCSCNQVGETDIIEAIRSGCNEVDTVAECTRAGTACGSCRPDLQRLIDSQQSSAKQLTATA